MAPSSSSSKPNLPAAAKPHFGNNFDPWNSSGTGHQRPEQNHGSTTGWRESRSRKLNSQFAAPGTGGDRLSDTWGAGAQDWDPKLGLNVRAHQGGELLGEGRNVADMLMRPGAMRERLSLSPRKQQSGSLTSKSIATDKGEETAALVGEHAAKNGENKAATQEAHGSVAGRKGGIFDGVVVYVNGSTYPLVSDHRLKQILVENGGNMALQLGRRKVTHVIVGRPAAGRSSARGGKASAGVGGVGGGAGGGLAGGKLDKEIRRIGGRGVKFVGAEWYV